MSGTSRHGPGSASYGAGSGGWHAGDPVAQRKFADVGTLALERGGELPGTRIAYETWGTLNAERDNAVLIEHALTGDAHVVGEREPGQVTSGWWNGLIGPGRYLDTDRFFVIASNVLGGCQGSTGPSSTAPDDAPWGSRFPFVTIRDQVHAESALIDALGIDQLHAVIGGSMGGMRSLEWPLTHPERVRNAVVLASTPYATADQIAWCTPQLAAIEGDPNWNGGDYYYTGDAPRVGLGVARAIAHVTYRSEYELSARFGREAQPGEQPLGGGGRFAVESYLDHHRDKLVNRFDAGSYVVLTRAMNSHDIGRGRGALTTALRDLHARVTVVGVSSDRLYPVRLSEELYAALPEGRRSLSIIDSPYGHDGFLIEIDEVGKLIADAVG